MFGIRKRLRRLERQNGWWRKHADYHQRLEHNKCKGCSHIVNALCMFDADDVFGDLGRDPCVANPNGWCKHFASEEPPNKEPFAEWLQREYPEVWARWKPSSPEKETLCG